MENSEISQSNQNMSVGTFAPVSNFASVSSRTLDASMTFEGKNQNVQEVLEAEKAPANFQIERNFIQISNRSALEGTASFKFSKLSTPD